MSRGGWAALLGIALAAAALWWFFGRPRTPEPHPDRTLGLPAGTINGIERRGLDPFRLIRDPQRGWRFVEPADAEADGDAIQAYSSSLSRLAVTRSFPLGTLTDDTSDAYGFDAASSSLIWSTDDGRTMRWRLGTASPVGGARYFDREGTLLLVDGGVADAFFVAARNLRQRHLCPAAREGATAVQTGGDPGWRIEFDDAQGARMTAPAFDRVDPAAVDVLKRALRTLRVENHLDQVPLDALDPALSVRVDYEDGSCRFRISRGIDAERNHAVCRADGSLCGTIRDEALADWFREPDAWRDRRVFALSTPDVNEAIFEDRSARRRFVKEADGWTDSNGNPASSAWLARVPETLRSWRAIGFEAPAIEGERRRVLFLTAQETDPVSLAFGRHGARCIVEDIFDRRVEIECEALDALAWTPGPEDGGDARP